MQVRALALDQRAQRFVDVEHQVIYRRCGEGLERDAQRDGPGTRARTTHSVPEQRSRRATSTASLRLAGR